MNKSRQNGLGVEVVWHRRPTCVYIERVHSYNSVQAMRVILGKRVLLRSLCIYAGLAQLVRASALQAGGHWFESSTPHQKNLVTISLIIKVVILRGCKPIRQERKPTGEKRKPDQFHGVAGHYMVGVAQLVRALDCGSRGRRFKSALLPQRGQFAPLEQNSKADQRGD